MFNRKKPVGHADEHLARNPAKLAYQKQLIFHTTRMLEYSVGCRYLKVAVIKRQPHIRLYLNVADAREGALAGCQLSLSQVRVPQDVCAAGLATRCCGRRGISERPCSLRSLAASMMGRRSMTRGR